MILFLLVLFWALGAILFATYKILFNGKEEYLVVFMCLYLPVYTTVLSVIYQQTGSPVLVAIFQYAKELIVLFAFLAFIFYSRNFFSRGFSLLFIDYVFLAFLGLSFLYALLPIGAASFVERLVYYKNILMLGIMYFFGRNMKMEDVSLAKIKGVILTVAVAAFFLNLFEYWQGTHFQAYTGYGRYNEDINGVEPTGDYGLSWTFETQTGHKRYASFFSNPLESASAVLLGFPLALIMFLNVPHVGNKLKYLIVIICLLGSLWLSFSRASMAALFIQLFFIAFIFRYYKLIFTAIGLGVLAVIYFFLWASRDTQDFVYNTITFQDSSSFGHLIAWFEGISSMMAAPQGIGLAMSGNARGVISSLSIGGENQFIIFGVQLGVFGLFLYCLLLLLSIVMSLRAYRISEVKKDKVIPFVAAAAKVGFLLPLFTSNAELYLYFAFVSWWMVGYSVSIYANKKQQLVAAVSSRQ